MAFSSFLVEKMIHNSGHSGHVYETLPICRFVILGLEYLCALYLCDGDLFLLSLMGCTLSCQVGGGSEEERKAEMLFCSLLS